MPKGAASGTHGFAEQMAGHMARIRVWGAAGFLAIASVFGFWLGEPGSRAIVPGILVYFIAALLLRAGMRSEPMRRPLTVLWPFLDVGFVVIIRLSTIRFEPAPGTTAGWTVAILMLIVMLAALSLGRSLGLVVAAFTFVGAAAMLRAGGAVTSLIVASGVALVLANESANWAARLLDRAAELDEARLRLQQHHEELLVAQKQAEDLISFLVHDMKNPLTVATLVLGSVEKRVFDPEVRSDLVVIAEQHQRLLGMFGDMLSLARLEKGALQIRPRPTPVAELLHQVAQPHLPYCRSLRIELDVGADPALWVDLDPVLIHRALENLVGNALSKIDPGARLCLEGRREDGEVALAVRNTGSKIPADVRPRLFEKYSSDRAGGAHAGLGLYFCRLVAEAHHGRIELEESPRWPVSFVLRLPAAQAPSRST